MYKTVLLVACVAVAGLAKAQVENCRWQSVNSNGCQTYIMNPPRSNQKCRVQQAAPLSFSFYLKPGPNFRLLELVTSTAFWRQRRSLRIGYDILSDSQKWYHIEVKEEVFLYTRHTYTISVNGQQQDVIAILADKASSFNINVRGTSTFAASCNPALYVTRTPPRPQSTPEPRPPPRPQPTSQPRPVPTTRSLITVPPSTTLPPATTVLPQNKDSMPATENHPSEAGFRGDHNQTLLNVPNDASSSSGKAPPSYILVAGGVAGITLVTMFVVAVLVIHRKRSARESEALESPDAATDDTNFNSQQNLPDYSQGPDDYPNDHVYEEVDDLGPEWGNRRGSAHDSENSLYAASQDLDPIYEEVDDLGLVGCVQGRRGSAHESENSLYVPFDYAMEINRTVPK